MPTFLLLATTDTAQIAQSLGVDWRLLAAHLVCFLIVAAALRKFAYTPILAMLAERQARIARLAADTDQVKRELALVEAERGRVLHEANLQAAKLLEHAQEAAERLRDDELARAHDEAAQIIARAQVAARHEGRQMQAALEREIGQLAVQMAEAAARQALTPADHERLVAETMKGLPS